MREIFGYLKLWSVRKLASSFLLLLLGVGVVAATTIFVGGDILKHRIQARWPARLPDEIQLRSVKANHRILVGQGDRSDALVRIPVAVVKDEVTKLLAKLNDKKRQGKEGIELTILSQDINLGHQLIVPRVEFLAKKGHLAVRAEAAGFAAPFVVNNSVAFDIAVHSIK